MTWHTVTVATDQMSALLTTIWSTGGTVTHCQHQTDCVRLTWTTTDGPTTGNRQVSPDAVRMESMPRTS